MYIRDKKLAILASWSMIRYLRLSVYKSSYCSVLCIVSKQSRIHPLAFYK